jgi:hypothetical protein
MRTRSGTTLAELLVGMVVGAILSIAAFAALLQVQRSSVRLVRRTEDHRLGHEILSVLHAVGQHLRHPVVLADTALHGEWRLITGVVCAVGPSTLTLAPDRPGTLEALSFVGDLPVSGDLLEAWRDPASMGQGWEATRVIAVSQLSAEEGCGERSPYVAATLARRPVLRLAYSAAWPTVPGTPVEIYREVRLISYPSGLGGWSVGWRTCVQGSCTAPQPITGPVRSRSERGLTLSVGSLFGEIRATVRIPGSERIIDGVIGVTDVSQ